jgi:hypothetical protein
MKKAKLWILGGVKPNFLKYNPFKAFSTERWQRNTA